MFKVLHKVFFALSLIVTAGITYADYEVVGDKVWRFTVSGGKAIVGDGVNPALTKTPSGALEIPAKLGNCPVVGIASGAFYNNYQMTTVTIPPTVTSIGASAFYGCSRLFWITLPEGMTSIGESAFEGCAGMMSVTMPSSLRSTGEYAFYGCSGLSAVYIGDMAAWCNVDFGDGCGNPLIYAKKLYLNNEEVIDLDIPTGVEGIGRNAFGGCSGLNSVNIPNSVTSIGESAFYRCSGLVTVLIPPSVKSIGVDAFIACDALETVYVASGDAWRVRRLYSFDNSVKIVEMAAPTEVMAGDGISDDCLCISWKGVEGSTLYNIYRSTTTSRPVSPIQNGVVSPYNDTTAIPGVVYYYWVEAVNAGGLSISSCDSGYRAVSLSLGKSADSFTSSGGSGNVTVSANTVWVATSDVDWIKFDTPSGSGNGVLTYSVDAVLVAASRTGSITVTAGANTEHPLTKALTVTQYAANAAPTALGEVTASDGVHDDCVSISWASAVGATSYNVYRSTTTSRPASPMAQDVVSPYNDTAAIPGVKYYYWIEAANSAGSVVSSYDAGYRSVSLSLGSATCSCSLSGGKYGASVTANTSWAATTDADWITIEPQSDDGRLSFLVAANTTLKSRSCEITVTAGMGTCDPVSKMIQVSQNFDFVVVKGVLTQYTGGGGAIVIPSGVTSIGDYAFMDRTSLSSVIIPEGVTNIGDYAFCGCKYLNSIRMPESLMRIGTYAFGECRALTAVTIPSGVMSIGDAAFACCNKLTSVTIPPSVTTIRNSSFGDCKSLTTVTIPRSVTSISDSAFLRSGLKTVYVASGDASRIAKLYNFVSTVKFTNLMEVNASDGESADHVRVTWSASSGATLYRSTTADRSSTAMENNVSSPYNDVTATPGVRYYYWIKSSNNSLVSMYDSGHRVVSLSLDKSEVSHPYFGEDGSISVTANTSWKASSDVDWISFGTQSGDGDGTLTYTVSSCEAWFAREQIWGDRLGKIKVTAGYDTPYPVTRTILVRQRFDFKVNKDGVLTEYVGEGGDVVIPSCVTSIGDGAFSGCSGLKSVTIPPSVTSIGDDAFWWCSGLGAVTIPSTVTSIGVSAFNGCSGLTSLVIEEGVTRIGAWAFNNCDSLKSVTIPSSVTSIGNGVFSGCGKLKRISVSAGNLAYKVVNDCLVTMDGATLIAAPIGLGIIDLPAGITDIPSALFSSGVNLTSVTIPEGVKSIGGSAFYGCSGLASVTIPNGVTSIGNEAFRGCSGLTSVVMPSTVTSIGRDAFRGCSELTSVAVPACVASLSATFPDAYKTIRDVRICDGVARIEERAFSGCVGLETVTIPPSVTSVGDSAFEGCDGLDSVSISDLASWCEIEFADLMANPLHSTQKFLVNGEEITELQVPDGVERIGDYAFYGRSGLTSVTIPPSVTSVGDSAFAGCDGLDSVSISDLAAWCEIEFGGLMANPLHSAQEFFVNGVEVTKLQVPDGVVRIGDYAFYGRSVLTSVTMPSSVTSIGEHAFDGCGGLSEIAVPKSVMAIGYGALSRCSGLKKLTVPFVGAERANAGSEKAVFGFIFGTSEYSKATQAVQRGITYYVPTSLKTVVITDETNIDKDAFSGCSTLTSVTIPDGVTNIGEYAFSGCAYLTSITVPKSVMKIGGGAFSGCSRLQSMTLPFVGAQRNGTFSKNSQFGYIFGTSRYFDAIETCQIYDVWCPDPTMPYSRTFSEVTYYIPASLKSAVITDETTITCGAFSDCKGLTSVAIPASVTSIGSYAFYGCSGLTSMTIPSSVMSIGMCSFYGCGLETVTISEGVQDIGSEAFRNCWRLQSMTIPSSVKDVGKYAFDTLSSLTVCCSGSISDVRGLLYGSGHEMDRITFKNAEPVYSYFRIMFDATEGSVNRTEVEVRAGKQIGELPIAGRRGYEFLGWFTAAEGGTRVSAETIPSKSCTVYAQWEKTVVTMPVIDPPDGSEFRTASCLVSIDCATADAAIYVGIGEVPKIAAEFLYSAPYAIDETSTIYTYAVKNGVSSPTNVAMITKRYMPTFAEAVSAEGITSFEIGGDANWIVSEDGNAKFGAVSVRSGAIGDDEISWFSTKVVGAGTLSFWWKASCEEDEIKNFDHLVFTVDDKEVARLDGVSDWERVSVELDSGTHTLFWAYEKDGSQHEGEDCGWVDGIVWTPSAAPNIEGDAGATVTGDAETGFVIRPSEGKTAVEVTIPQGVNAAKVTVEVSPKVASVKPNGAKVKIVVGENDITGFLVIPESEGVLNIAAATVKEEIVKETLDPTKEAVLELNAANPQLITAPTRKGLTYTLYEGHRLESLSKGDSKLGDGNPWMPTIRVSGGDAAFYSIDVSK